jgi:DnaJ family protein C protein 17
MPIEDDLLEHAKSGIDFYALLGEDIHAASSEKDISRAYRRTALKHHPDKHKDDPNAVARFHALQVAYDVLSDPAARAAYDAAREARERKKQQTERLDGRRKAFADDLLRAEKVGTDLKRKRENGGAEEDALDKEIKRLADDGRRRRQARANALRKEVEESLQEEEKVSEEGEKVPQQNGSQNVPEISRTVKVRFHREGPGANIDKRQIEVMFGYFGAVDSALMLKDRKMRPAEGEKKQNMGTAAVAFYSVVSAHAAVEDFRKQSGSNWELVNNVEWAEGKEPEFLKTLAASSPHSSVKAPSFSSFKAPAFNGPSFEEMTFIRLKKAEQRKAEKRKLEDQIRRDEEDSAKPNEIPTC